MLLAASLLLWSAACANYDFARARNADGSFDHAKLIADLDASGESSLIDWIWIPLIYLDMTTFSRADFMLANGYRLNTGTSFGPLFLIGSGRQTLVDEHGAEAETTDGDWLLLGLWENATTHVATDHGRRTDDRTRALFGILHWEDVGYETVTDR